MERLILSTTSDAAAGSLLSLRSSDHKNSSPIIFGLLVFILDQLIRMPLFISLYPVPDCAFRLSIGQSTGIGVCIPYGARAKSTAVVHC